MQEVSVEQTRSVESPPPSQHTAFGTSPWGPLMSGAAASWVRDAVPRSERPGAMDVDDPPAAQPDVSLSHERSVELPPPPSKYTAFGTGPGVAQQPFGPFSAFAHGAPLSTSSCSALFNIKPGSLPAPTYTPVKAEEKVGTTESLAISIQSKLNQILCPDSRRIYRVPKPLRVVKEEAYTPTIVSIGPYHHKNLVLFPMQSYKLNYLSSFLHDSKANGDLKIYLQTVKNREAMIREYCADLNTVEFSADEFIEMILVDSVFIIEVFRGVCGCRKVDDDSILKRPYLLNYIRRDILLAENQLPFFILASLFRTGFKPADNSQYVTFTDMACKALELDKSKIDVDVRTGEAKCCHLLDLLRAHHLPTSQERTNMEGDYNMMCPSITQLFEAGVKFQAKETKCPLLDIEFDKSKAILSIPKIVVTDDTEFQLRNLIAFEQCDYPGDSYVSEYRLFMDCLINTTNDVELLVKAGIIENWLGSNEEVRDMYNNLGKHVNVNPDIYFFAGITRDLHDHYNWRWNKYRATLKHNYFSHPWAAISVVYAAVLLILTIVQVVTGILSM